MEGFEEDPAADFLAREQDDLAELGEDFGGGEPEANVSVTRCYFKWTFEGQKLGLNFDDIGDNQHCPCSKAV